MKNLFLIFIFFYFPGLLFAQIEKIDLGISYLSYDKSSKMLKFNSIGGMSKILADDMLFPIGFQYYINQKDSLIFVYGQSITNSLSGTKYSFGTTMWVSKYNIYNCKTITEYSSEIVAAYPFAKNADIRLDNHGHLNIVMNNKIIFSYPVNKISEKKFEYIHLIVSSFNLYNYHSL